MEWERRGGYCYYYGLCTVGGMISAGTTHLVITPLDVLKVHMQVNPAKYNSMSSCFTTLLREGGVSAFWRGWAGKFYGYGLQGGFRFGLYEYLKSFYSNVWKDGNRSLVYFASSASAEVLANLALCPFEAVKVRVQTQPHFAEGLFDGFPKLYATEGFSGFYRGLIPLWGRNLPCTLLIGKLIASTSVIVFRCFELYYTHGLLKLCMIMFSTFEHSVDIIYRRAIQRRKEECSMLQQLAVTCLAGYAAGSIGSIVSNPADILVASLNNEKPNSIKQAIKKIGFFNLFTRSLPIRVMLVGPVVTLQWLLYDTIKVLSGLPTSGEVKTDSIERKH